MAFLQRIISVVLFLFLFISIALPTSSNSYGRSTCREAVWDKAKTIRGRDPTMYRQDPYGNQIDHARYGQDTNMGWHLDQINIKPTSKGGSDDLRNLPALPTSTNKSLGNNLEKKRR